MHVSDACFGCRFRMQVSDAGFGARDAGSGCIIASARLGLIACALMAHSRPYLDVSSEPGKSFDWYIACTSQSAGSAPSTMVFPGSDQPPWVATSGAGATGRLCRASRRGFTSVKRGSPEAAFASGLRCSETGLKWAGGRTEPCAKLVGMSRQSAVHGKSRRQCGNARCVVLFTGRAGKGGGRASLPAATDSSRALRRSLMSAAASRKRAACTEHALNSISSAPVP